MTRIWRVRPNWSPADGCLGSNLRHCNPLVPGLLQCLSQIVGCILIFVAVAGFLVHYGAKFVPPRGGQLGIQQRRILVVGNYGSLRRGRNLVIFRFGDHR